MAEKYVVDKFEGTDFGFWKMQIEDYLYGKDLFLPAIGKKPDDMDEAAWTLLDRKAMSAIRLSLSRQVAHHTTKAKSTKELLDILSGLYEKPSAINKVHLFKRLVNLKMSESEPADKHISEFNMMLSQLESVDMTFDDEVQACLLLSTLPESWNQTVTALSASVGKEKLKLSDVRDLIISEEIRRRESGVGSSSGSALNAGNRGRGRSASKFRVQRGRSKSRGRDDRQQQKQPKDKSSVQCWQCKEFGHYQRDCRKPAVNAAAEDVGEALILSVSSPLESWVLDSGASFHSCSSPDLMKNYVAGNFGKVYLADDEALDIAGKGDVTVRAPGGAVVQLKNVRHIPGLKRNLLSVGQLDEEGYVVTFGCKTWKITKGALVIARGKKEGTLYVTGDVRDSISVARADCDADLWHCRLGHMSEKGMKVLCSRGLLPGLKSVEIGLCEDCIYGKQKRVSFSSGGRALRKEKLELVHSDLWGPAPVASMAGAHYYMTFIDDCTRKVWVYFLKNKSDAFDTFRKWKALVENETGLKVKCLRSDNGGEYELTRFKEFCAENGIRMEKTVAGTPQQNGVAERMNRTLNERARSMRLKSGLPKMFWAEAINTAAYLINRGPSSRLDNGIPEEAWSGKKVNLSFLRVFGCVAYSHIADAERSKLDAKSEKAIFVGYGGDEFGYRLWVPGSRKVLRSRDVVFDEKTLYKNFSAQSESNANPPNTPNSLENICIDPP